MTTNTGLLIGARDEAASDGRTFARMNPITGEVATRAAAAREVDAIRAVEAAAAAFPSWSELGPTARRAALNRAADALEAEANEIETAMRDEVGATEGWA